MRLKSFTAPSIAEAMQMVRQDLGEEAIIVSTQRAAGSAGVRVTAALEQDDANDAVSEMLGGGDSSIIQSVNKALTDHGLPQRILERLVNAARVNERADAIASLAAALETGFAFAPLPEVAAPRPFMLIGAPGSGKSIAVAKLAARSVLRHRKVGVITTDGMRAGAVEQLAAFTKILEIELQSTRSPEALQTAIEQTAPNTDLIFIDTPGVNPFKSADLDYLASLTSMSDVEPIVVMPGGIDAVEAAEQAEAFASVGATRLFCSKLDTTRRMGGMFAAAESGQLIFSELSSSQHVASGLGPANSLAIARLMLPKADSRAEERKPLSETAS